MSIRDRFLRHFVQFYNDKGNVRIQKARWIQKYCGEIFTITIQRGDKLNSVQDR